MKFPSKEANPFVERRKMGEITDIKFYLHSAATFKSDYEGSESYMSLNLIEPETGTIFHTLTSSQIVMETVEALNLDERVKAMEVVIRKHKSKDGFPYYTLISLEDIPQVFDNNFFGLPDDTYEGFSKQLQLPLPEEMVEDGVTGKETEVSEDDIPF